MEKTSSRGLLPKDGEKISSIIGKLLLFLYIFFKILYNFCYLCYYCTDSDPVDSRVARKRSALSVKFDDGRHVLYDVSEDMNLPGCSALREEPGLYQNVQ